MGNSYPRKGLSDLNLLSPLYSKWIMIAIIFNNVSQGFSDTDFNSPKTFVSMDRLTTAAEYLEQKLIKFHSDNTYLELLQPRDDRLPVKEIRPEEMIEAMELKISSLIQNRKLLLEDIVSSLEVASHDFIWDDDLKNDFSNVVLMNSSTEEAYKDHPGVEDEKFGVKINTSLTGVHVPLEIYEGYPEIVNGLKWSAGVDDVFKRNLEKEKSLSWQFFASQSGYMRMYPSVLSWYIPPPYDPVDLFDSKRRPWYMQGAVSPKDVIILMDRSGSVHGQTFTIMKFAVQMLLDTLAEDDFVNIAVFNETTHWLSEVAYEDSESIPAEECLAYNHTLIQATNVNKKALVDDMQLVRDAGMSNYTRALTFAYETFKNRASYGDRGSNCLKLIMLLTDGGTDWPKQVFDQYLNDTDTEDVRIFTYAVGPHPIPVAVLKDMSCYTGGKLTTIMTSSGVRTKIQDSYLDVIAEPIAEASIHTLQFTSAYTSAVTQNLTITMTMPVFNQSDQLSNATLAGVAGIDIPVHDLINMSPRLKMGPLGYTFIINHNGFLISHPRLRAQPSYLQDPPHIDLLDIELNEAEMAHVRGPMVDSQTGSFVINRKILTDQHHIVPTGRLQYMYRPIEGTPFSLGMVVQPRSKYLDIVQDVPDYLLDEDTCLLAPWDLCGTQPSPLNASHINRRLTQSQQNCDKSLMGALYWAHEWTNAMTSKWAEQPIEEAILNLAVFTRFGYASFLKNDNYEPLEDETEVPDAIPGAEWRDPAKNPALKQGILSDGLHMFPHDQGAFLSRPARVNAVVAGVVGVNVSSRYLDAQLEAVMKDILPNTNSVVMLVDQSAQVIASTSRQEMCGVFLGWNWPLLLDKLTEAGIYSRQPINDFFALCDTKPVATREVTASASKLLFRPLAFAASTVWRLVALFESLQYLTLYGSLGGWGGGAEAVQEAAGNHSCILQKSIYHFTQKTSFSGNITCLGDSAQVHVIRLKQTNAVLIAVEQSLVTLSCDGWRDTPFATPHGARLIQPKQLACQRPRYRRLPTQCYARTPQKCNSAASLMFSLSVLCLVVVIGWPW